MRCIKGFLSYSHIDTEIKELIARHLLDLKTTIGLDIWMDDQLPAGSRIEPDILNRLQEAQVILLLVSPHFIASKFCYSIEMREAFKLQEQQRVLIIPIFLDTFEPEAHPFEDLKSLPGNPRYLSQWADRDAAGIDISQGVRFAIEHFVDQLIDHRKTDIQVLAMNGELEQACNRLMDFAKQLSMDTVGDTRAAMTLRSELITGLRSRPDDPTFRTYITSRVFALIDQIVSPASRQPAADAANADAANANAARAGTTNADATDATGADANPGRAETIFKEHAFRKVFPEGGLTRDTLAEMRGVKKGYRKFGFKLAIDHLQVHAGSITGLVGKNGAGKTTLLKMLSGILAPDEGAVSFPYTGKDKNDWGLIKQQVKYLPQDLAEMRGRAINTIRLNAVLAGIDEKEIDFEVDYILARLGIDVLKNARWAELSGGYRLKFALAGVLICKPRLMLLDEPLAFLDIASQVVLLNDLVSISRSISHPIAIVLSSQLLEEVEAVADNMIVLGDGGIAYAGPTSGIGSNRKVNTFKIRSPLNEAELRARLSGLGYQELVSTSLAFTLSTPMHITMKELMGYILEKNIPVIDITDESVSTKSIFNGKS